MHGRQADRPIGLRRGASDLAPDGRRRLYLGLARATSLFAHGHEAPDDAAAQGRNRFGVGHSAANLRPLGAAPGFHRP